MNLSWRDLTFPPSEEAIEELREAWSWLIPESIQPVFASALGDLYYLDDAGAVFWLNTGTAELLRIAESRAEFDELLETEASEDWFLPDLIAALIEAGKPLREGQCYGFGILPVFKQGKYEVKNLKPVSLVEHFGFTGAIHKQLKELPDGEEVTIEWT